MQQTAGAAQCPRSQRYLATHILEARTLVLLERAQLVADEYFELIRLFIGDSSSDELAHTVARLRHWGRLAELAGELNDASFN